MRQLIGAPVRHRLIRATAVFGNFFFPRANLADRVQPGKPSAQRVRRGTTVVPIKDRSDNSLGFGTEQGGIVLVVDVNRQTAFTNIRAITLHHR